MNNHVEVSLPSGKTAKLKSYLTGREKRALRDLFLQEADVKTVDGKPTLEGMKGAAISKAEDASIVYTVVELEGSTADILNRVLDLPSTDYDALLASINEVTGDKKK